MTMTDDNDSEVGGSGVRRTPAATQNDKRRARPSTFHFKRLLEEACPNHTNPVRHKLKDCSMIRSFMISGSITGGAELNEGPNGSDTTSFPEENAIMTVYEGCHPTGRRRVSCLRPRPPTHYGWGHGGSGV
jgi:hypothetical protein